MEYNLYVVMVLLLVSIVRSQSYEPWSQWSKCSVTCGVGTRRRLRQCANGLCTQRQTQGCFQEACPGSPQVNRFSEWKDWSSCSKTCGDGMQERERSCIGGGCIQKERKTCRLRTCKEDIEDWSQWTSCSATCGAGLATRQRRCAIGSCVEKQSKTCYLRPCSPKNVTARFETWQKWSDCSATCGQGERQRIRKCKSGTCQETAVQTCSVKTCGVSAVALGDWQTWGKCSATCGTGIRKRKRNCVVGFCEQTQTSSCRVRSCPGGSSDEYMDWQAWEPCSVTCGIGEQKRIRRCVVGLCQQVMRKACFAPACEGQTREDNFLPWASWSECTEKCGGGERRRARLCKAPANCVENQAQSCNVQVCDGGVDKGFGEWSEWSQCSATCGSGTARRQRKNLNTGRTRDQLKQCTIKKCETVDDKYKNWSEWSGCSVTCGTGISTRVRQCRVGSCQDTQTKPCTLEDCKPIDLDKKYGNWLSWSRCSLSCGFGFSRRERYCRIGECKQTSSKTCRLGPCPTDYTEWEDWGECSVTCGSGISTRKRYCTVGTCEEKQKTPCDMPTCATGWEDWSDWKGCDRTCGGGYDHRTRRCEEPLPSVQCPGDDTSYRRCNMHPCINGTWGEWAEWEVCSVTCGTGSSTRKRVCELGKCDGEEEETRTCNADACIQARWSNWSVWSDCTVTCGVGERARTRICINGKRWDKGCFGSNLTKMRCNKPSCDKAQWSKWSPWRPCSASCGEGTTNRERVCIRKTSSSPGCRGPSSETNKCESVACSTGGDWTTWSSWSTCSTNCGKGMSTRLRTCTGGSDCEGQSEEKKECEIVDHSASTESWGKWSQWTRCSVTCGLGTIQRERNCLSCPEKCLGQSQEVDTCEKEDCSKSEWGEWQSWSKCSATCDEGLTIRIRQCVGGTAGDVGCTIGGRESEICSDGPCGATEKVSTTEWSLWSTWSNCPVTCGSGTQSRSRTCSQPGSCNGESEEAVVCDQGPCPNAQVIPGTGKLNDNAGRTVKSDVAAGDVPWHVLLYSDINKVITEANKAKLGGGSLINDKWVLTSAHIIDDSQRTDPTSIVLLFGVVEEISGPGSVPSHAQFYRAGKIIRHPKFNKRIYDYDLSLVKVGARLEVDGGALVPDRLGRGGKVQFDQYVHPIALPCISSCNHVTDTTQNGISISPFNRIKCLKYARRFKSVTKLDTVVSGYSAAKVGDSSKLRLYSKKLLKANKCRNEMKKIRLVHKWARFTGRNICTDKKAAPQPCAGSSGDPLIKQVQGTNSEKCWVLLGVITRNWSCTTSNVQYYADVPDLISWIAKSMV